MQIEYAVSIWNHTHHASVGRLEDEIALIREQDLGVELWGSWRHERDLYSEENRARLRPVLEGLTVSLHSAFGASWDHHRRQVDAAADWGGRVVVLHSSDLISEEGKGLDVGLAREVVAYAAERQVRIALENGQLPFLMDDLKMISGRNRGLPDIFVPCHVDTSNYFCPCTTVNGDIEIAGKNGFLRLG